MNWEDQFRQWAQPPGKTEEDRCANAVSAITNAIRSHSKLQQRSIKVFTQGSYRNRVNVRADSDVDIGVLCSDVFFYDLPDGSTSSTFGIEPASYDFSELKQELYEALRAHFSTGSVTRGNKAIDIRGNSYHVEADVAPFFQHRRYAQDGSYICGVEMRPDKGGRVINWPERLIDDRHWPAQHYENAVAKNQRTGRRYKAVTRIIKSLRMQMESSGSSAALAVPGFLVECLVWNVPDDHFGHDSYTADVRASLAYLFNNTRSDAECGEWGEVSEFKYLFRGQSWSRSEAHEFVSKAWDFLGFE